MRPGNGIGDRRARRGWIEAGRVVGFEREGLEAFELVERIAVVALGGVDEALETIESAIAMFEGLAERSVFVDFIGGFDFVGPDMGLGGTEAAEGPDAADEDIDLVALGGGDGAIVPVILVGEDGELRGIFPEDDEGLGVDAGFQGIHGGASLAGGGAGPGRGIAWGAMGADGLYFRHRRIGVGPRARAGLARKSPPVSRVARGIGAAGCFGV